MKIFINFIKRKNDHEKIPSDRIQEIKEPVEKIEKKKTIEKNENLNKESEYSESFRQLQEELLNDDIEYMIDHDNKKVINTYREEDQKQELEK